MFDMFLMLKVNESKSINILQSPKSKLAINNKQALFFYKLGFGNPRPRRRRTRSKLNQKKEGKLNAILVENIRPYVL